MGWHLGSESSEFLSSAGELAPLTTTSSSPFLGPEVECGGPEPVPSFAKFWWQCRPTWGPRAAFLQVDSAAGAGGLQARRAGRCAGVGAGQDI